MCPFPPLAGHKPTAQMAEVTQAEVAAALAMVDGVHILDGKKMSSTGLGSKGKGPYAHGGSEASRAPKEGPTLTH